MGLNISHTIIAGSILIITMALVGCLGGDDGADPAGDGADDEQVEGTGGVKGRVLTMDLDEVADARVSLVAEAELVAEARSQEDGVYEIRNVEPGDYRLQVTAPCCREFVQGVAVVEGETTNVDVQLTRFTADDLRQPYVQEFEWNGFMACGFVAISFAGDACEDVDDQSDRVHLFEIDPGIETLTAGLVWGSPGLAGDRLQYGFARDPCDGATCTTPTDYYGFNSGESPVLLRSDAGSENGSQTMAGIEETIDVQMRVFPEFQNVNVFYQQEFTVYYQLHYHAPAPEGYNPLPDQ